MTLAVQQKCTTVHRERAMQRDEIPRYAALDDYRYTQRIAVIVRWVMSVVWMSLINYKIDRNLDWVILNSMGSALVVFNAYVQWRLWTDRPVGRVYAYALSIADLAVITTGIAITSVFGNPFYVFYYPALLGASLVMTPRFSFGVLALTVLTYTTISVFLGTGVHLSVGQEKVLILRLAGMLAIVVGASLIIQIERTRRQEAVAAERARMEENVQLEQRALKAEREVQSERIRISQEIHDGAAQSAYILSIGLETCRRLGEQDPSQILDRLEALHAQSKQALWELRYPINLGPIFEGKRVARIMKDHLLNFETITAIPSGFSQTGEEPELPLVTKQRLFSVFHNALTNAYKNADASSVSVGFSCSSELLTLSVSDDGIGVDTETLASSSGHGVRNMRRVAQELGGRLDVSSAPGEGTTVTVAVPLAGSES